jgi:hypothetical protein
MRAEDALLLTCTRQDFLPSYRDKVLRLAGSKDVEWERICATAAQHRVAPLVYVNLLKCGPALSLPSCMHERFEELRKQNVSWKQSASEQLSRVLTHLATRAIDAMLLKGSALDLLVYDEPWYTAAADVDLALRCRKGDQNFEWLCELLKGFRGMDVECDFYEHHDMTMNGILPVDFDQVWRDAKPVELAGHKVFLMSPEDLLLSICINSCRKRFLRLRSICDIAECVSRLKLDWDRFARRARDVESETIVYTSLFITQLTLGCKIPPKFTESLRINPLRSRLIRSLVHTFLRTGSFASFVPIIGDCKIGASLILPYASYHWSQAARSLLWSVREKKRALRAARYIGLH